jgi:dolichyl-phosphate beta-glucosyltransferase
VKIKQPYYRILIGRIGNVVTKLFFIKKIKDTQCGFKLFTNESAKKIFAMQKIKGFAFDVEILLIGEKLKYKIIEIPVSWLNSTESRIRPIRDSVKTLGELAFIKINDLSGRYLEEVA